MLAYAKKWLELIPDRRALSPLEYGLTASLLVATLTAGMMIWINGSIGPFGH